LRRFQTVATIAFCVAAALSSAQALVIGIADQGNSIPFGQTTGGFIYQQIYGSTNFASSMNINEITFYNSLVPGGTPMTGHFDIYLSTTSFPVGGLPTDVLVGFPSALTKVFTGTLPSVSAGRLDFDLTHHFSMIPPWAIC
jgi:hypothetical protein